MTITELTGDTIAYLRYLPCTRGLNGRSSPYITMRELPPVGATPFDLPSAPVSMARFPFPSITIFRACDFTFHLFWIFLMCVFVGVVWPVVQTANTIQFQSNSMCPLCDLSSRLILFPLVTDLERLAYDISRAWYIPMLWLCVILSVG